MEIFHSYVSMPEGNILFLNCDEFKWFYLFWILWVIWLLMSIHGKTWAPGLPHVSVQGAQLLINAAAECLTASSETQSIPWSKWLTPAQNECFWGATQHVHLAWLWSSGEVAWLASTYGAIGGYDESWSTDGAFTSWLSQLSPFL